MSIETVNDLDIDRSRGNFSYPEQHQFDAGIGLNHQTIDYITDVKGEADWFRRDVDGLPCLKCREHFCAFLE